MGVSAASLGLIGPALPSRFNFPPEGRFAVTLKGKDDAKEKLLTLMVTLSYARGFSSEWARLTVRRPSVTASFCTERLGLLLVAGWLFAGFSGCFSGCAGFAGSAVFGGVPAGALLFPKLEKFQRSPSCERTK